MNVTDRVCNLECVKDGTVHEFVGPVKIILVDPPKDEYRRRKTGAAFVALANMMIGANVTIVTLFTLGFKLSLYNNLHILLCTIGYQFLMPSAILMLHALNGAAAPLKKSERRSEHIILHILGIACGIGGTAVINMYGQKSFLDPASMKKTSYHYYSGMAVALFSVSCVVSGTLVFLRKKELIRPTLLTYLHRSLGIVAYFLSSVCFLLGVMKPSFQIWVFIVAYLNPTFVISFFTIFYTTVVIVTPALKFSRSSKPQ